MTRAMYYYFNTMTHCICLGDRSIILSWHSSRRRWKPKRDCFVAVEILLKWHYCILSFSSYLYIYILYIIMAIADRPTYGTTDASTGRRRLHGARTLSLRTMYMNRKWNKQVYSRLLFARFRRRWRRSQ